VKIATVKSYEKRGAELIGKVNVGDVVRITADIGWVSVDADYRIIQMKLDPQTDTVDFTVNPFEEWNDPYQAWEIQA
jgi:spore coat polysaccharide biosynthesis protein SpsF (cytidylyltransferase family)